MNAQERAQERARDGAQARDIGIVGAGIIGVAAACHLAEKGVNVTVFDPEKPGAGGASHGNAAQIFPALIHPLASPATLRDAVRLLTSRASPLIIPPAYSLQIAPWLMEFVRASRPSHYQRGLAALTDLNRHAYEVFTALLARAGKSELLQQAGAIQLYESRRTFAAGLDFWSQVPPSHAGAVRALDEAALRDKEPALGPSFKGGVLIPHTGVLTDPAVVVTALADYAQRLGVRFTRDRAARVTSAGEGATTGEGAAIHLPAGDIRSFDAVVIAAGVWSRQLCAELGEPHRLEAERGYNLTLDGKTKVINHALVFAERGVVATQLAGGLRFGGWDELGGISAPPNPKIFNRLQNLAQELLPGMNWANGRPWMGHRPSLPDGLPVIGQSQKHRSVYYAFGHGHLGMTQGPVTGEAIAALITRQPPRFDVAPFAPR